MPIKPIREPGAALPAETAATEDFVELSPERRAALIAFVETSPRMSDTARDEVLARLREDRVPSEIINRIEARMGG